MSGQDIRNIINLMESVKLTEMAPIVVEVNWNTYVNLGLDDSGIPNVYDLEKIPTRKTKQWPNDRTTYKNKLTIYDLDEFLNYIHTNLDPRSNRSSFAAYTNLIKRVTGDQAAAWLDKYPPQGSY